MDEDRLAKGRVIGNLHGLAFVREADHGRYRPEYLFMRDRHVRGDAGQNDRRVKCALLRNVRSCSSLGRALDFRLLDQVSDATGILVTDQRTHARRVIDAVAYTQCLDTRGQAFDKSVMNACLNQKPVGADAGLPGIAKA